MGLLGAELAVALDAAAVSVAGVARGPRHRRLRGFQRIPLEAGALLPSPTGSNVARRDEVREALSHAVGEVSPGGGRVTLVLPDGVARLSLVELPSRAHPRDYVRFRLAPSLPWPASDAMVEVLHVDRRRVVGAAVRRATVLQYEQLAASAGLSMDRVHLAPLLALSGLMGRAGRSGRTSVHALLGDVALCLAVIRDGQLVALRSRRRDTSPGEGHRLLAEAARTALQSGDGDGPPHLVLSGAGAARLADDMDPSCVVTGGPEEWPEACEASWLRGLS